MTLDEALARARGGDIEAFELVVRETATALRAYLALHVRDAEAAADLAQETYLYAFEHLQEFTPGTELTAWLKAVARIQALRAWRERQRKEAAHRRYVLAVQDRVVRRAEELDTRSPVEGLLERVRRCMERLADRARELVRMRYFENRSIDQIARAQGTSVNHVSVTLHRVRAQLSACAEGAKP